MWSTLIVTACYTVQQPIYLRNGFCLNVWVPLVRDGGILGAAHQVYAHAAPGLFFCDL